MYRVDMNNVITRISDSRIIARDVNSKDYQDFWYAMTYRLNPSTGAKVTGFANIQSSEDRR